MVGLRGQEHRRVVVVDAVVVHLHGSVGVSVDLYPSFAGLQRSLHDTGGHRNVVVARVGFPRGVGGCRGGDRSRRGGVVSVLSVAGCSVPGTVEVLRRHEMGKRVAVLVAVVVGETAVDAVGADAQDVQGTLRTIRVHHRVTGPGFRFAGMLASSPFVFATA